MDADQELLAVFRAEVEEQIDDLCYRLSRDPKRWQVDRLLRISHNVKGAARLVGADAVRDVAHTLEDLFAALRDGLQITDELVHQAREGSELLEKCFRSLDEGETPELAPYRQAVRDLVDAWTGKEHHDTPAHGPDDETASRPDETDSKPSEDAKSTSQRDEQPRPGGADETLRVGAFKVDTLLEHTSELATHLLRSEGHQAAAKQVAANLERVLQLEPRLRTLSPLVAARQLTGELTRQLADHISDGLRVSHQLQGSVRALRLVRVDGLKTLLSRSLRDACKSTGKKAELHISGGETEVDRAVLEQLRDPLVHLVRNCVAHGIEKDTVRRKEGKDEEGQVLLTARSVGSWVKITVSDDGRGIDPGIVRKQAMSSSLITIGEANELSDEEVLQLVFVPGFSTAEEVTVLAGRGVGLDVVKSQVSRLGGSVSISSTLGKGAEITLLLPLTRLTTTGVVVRCNDQVFAVPTSDVERTVLTRAEDVSEADGGEVVAIDDQLLRVASLGGMLSSQGNASSAGGPALVVREGGRRCVIIVEEVIGQREYIAQPLPWNVCDSAYFSGCAVVDGSDIVLVLNSRELVRAHTTGLTKLQSPKERVFRLLVIDDSATSRTLESNILKAAGYEVETAFDGAEALDLLQQKEFDLVISDVQMPRVDGFELTQSIRRDAKLERVPVILVTSMGSEEDKQKGAESGADAYIVKGAFDQEELLNTVARLL